MYTNNRLNGGKGGFAQLFPVSCCVSPQRAWQKWGQTSTWRVLGPCQTQTWWVWSSPPLLFFPHLITTVAVEVHPGRQKYVLKFFFSLFTVSWRQTTCKSMRLWSAFTEITDKNTVVPVFWGNFPSMPRLTSFKLQMLVMGCALSGDVMQPLTSSIMRL